MRCYPLPTTVLENTYSAVSLGADGRLLRIGLSARGTYRIPLRLEDISPELKAGVLAYEDQYFYRHPGVNPIAFLRSAIANVRHARVLMGGSTITMQVAKLMEPKPRTFRSKLFEIFRAFQLESVYSKDQLLALYLNLVPMGGNIEGVGAASYLYFGKPARGLSLSESALLIGLPRSPGHFRPDRHAVRAKEQRNRVLERMQGTLHFPPEILRAAEAAPIPERRFPNPYAYPHLIQRLARSQSTLPLDAFSQRLTINPRLQALAETRLRATLAALASAGVHNGAVIIVENKTQRVRAYVGSPDFMDQAHGGQINGAAIRRSPGSLLKPFLYGLAIDQGRLTPRQLVYDIERNYDGYIPANFDRRFAGPVSAEEALVRSLNVPAVNLEFELGTNGLISLLRRAGFLERRPSELAPGLSAVLGAVPLTLEEMVRLYAAIANGGEMKDLVFFDQDSARTHGVRILSPESSFLVSEMLSKLERPDLPQSWEFTANRGKIAFKTGTSFGLRDAWSVGFNPRYTIGVWLGNVDAKGSSALVGIKAAAPLLVSLFNDVDRYQDGWFKPPPGVRTRAVCALSGEPLGPDCTGHATDFYIPGVSGTNRCSVHRRIAVRKKDGVEMCRFCMDGARSDYSERVVETWPPDVASFLRKRGDHRVFLPPHNPQCRALHENEGLKVRSPLPGGFYAVTDAVARGAQKIPLQVQSRQSNARVFWYVDDVLMGSGSPDEVLYVTPAPGRHRATVLDALGRHDSVDFRVQRSF
jgi:penicillin-binding protein 1C